MFVGSVLTPQPALHKSHTKNAPAEAGQSVARLPHEQDWPFLSEELEELDLVRGGS